MAPENEQHDEADARPNPRVAVTAIVCTRNRPQFLADCLASISSAMAPQDELIVVESGDSKAAEALASLDPAVSRVHLRATDRRKSVKINMAIREASGELLALTDDDCRVDPDWINAMAAAVGSDERVGVAFGPVAGLDHAPGGSAPPRIPPGPAPIENWNYAHGASMAVRRTAAVDVGGFDERLGPGAPTHGEEADLLLRMAASGWKCVVADAPPVTHLDWRDAAETQANLLVYERGAGAWLGVGLRRDPRRVAKLFVLRLRYQAGLWTDRRSRGRWYGPRTTAAFFGGVLRGLTYPPRRWL
jgi:GT2 family glycosyltransferase